MFAESPMFKEVRAGFEPEARQARLRNHRSIALVELMTTAALALSTAVAVTVVSLGIARAGVAGSIVTVYGASFTIALFIGLLLSAMGGFTAIGAVATRE